MPQLPCHQINNQSLQTLLLKTQFASKSPDLPTLGQEGDLSELEHPDTLDP